LVSEVLNIQNRYAFPSFFEKFAGFVIRGILQKRNTYTWFYCGIKIFFVKAYIVQETYFIWVQETYFIWVDLCTGFPCYSLGLRSRKNPRITKPRITRKHCLHIFPCFLRQLSLKSSSNGGKSRGYQILVSNRHPRIVKTTNNKPEDNEGRMYIYKLSTHFGTEEIVITT